MTEPERRDEDEAPDVKHDAGAADDEERMQAGGE